MENKNNHQHEDSEYLDEFHDTKGCMKPLLYFVIIGLLTIITLWLTSL